ncbi:hypothetical protein R5R35_009509 [Gryllus longicercus]|uniref:Dehydrogenase/reductase SDR family member 11 n=1 Tax=Gryllus longicercus TaxID=2509291 RepID=A0AAN9Z760_9ORTH
MQRWAGRVAMVTGASAGIGAAIAYQLQDVGMNVVALARGVDKIPGAVEAARSEAAGRGRSVAAKAAAPGKLLCRACDVQREADITAAFAWAKEALGGVDVLVNCAGLAGDTRLLDTNTSDWKKVLDINVLGLSICTREAIQQMRARGVDDGHVVHISSVCGHIMPFLPEWSMYHASKHAVRVLTEGLRKELVAAKSRIRVTEVSPGMVRTSFLNETRSANPEEWYAQRAHLFPEDVADAVLYALGTPPHVQIHEIMIKPIGEEA